jgi:hypothetical protein
LPLILRTNLLSNLNGNTIAIVALSTAPNAIARKKTSHLRNKSWLR